MPETTVASWTTLLSSEKKQDYFKNILAFVKSERQKGKKIYPPQNEIFNAFKLTPYENLKVVIIGQDPYHGPGQAHGLSFSVKAGVRPPPSLKNIYREINSDIGLPIPTSGCLEQWAKQGVLLLNAVLTVEQSQPQSHAKIGWQRFTDKVIEALNNHPEPLVFMLWGAYAQRKCENIDRNKHLVLTSTHPSPLSAHRGFLGCRHFSKANDWLQKHHKTPIDWSIKTA